MMKTGRQLLYKLFVELIEEGNREGPGKKRVTFTKYCHNRTRRIESVNLVQEWILRGP